MHHSDNRVGAEKESQAPFVARLFATGLFVGYAPWASGTLGTALGLAVFFIPGVQTILLPMIAVGIAVGVITSGIVARAEGHRLSKTAEQMKSRFQPAGNPHPDPSIVVIDEIVGMWIALVAVPRETIPVILAFFFFRLFDIIKPAPAHQLEHLPGGWGIMLDDVVAGMYANLAVHALMLGFQFFFPSIIIPGI
jgi:phosphatidylglycerophosphatase A